MNLIFQNKALFIKKIFILVMHRFIIFQKVELLAEIIKSVSEWGNHGRGETSKKVREHAVEFSWDVTVERLLTEFKKAIESFN